MSIRDHFRDKNKTRTKLGTLKSKVVETDQTESLRYLENYKTLKETYYPPTDYTNADNFSKYSNPVDAYEVAIRRIYESYPYDGALSEKVAWQNSNGFLDKDLFENEYPRQTGFITLSSSAHGWGARVQQSSSSLYGYPDSEEFISFFGGPHSAKSEPLVDRDLGVFKNKTSANSIDWIADEGIFDNMKLSNLYVDARLGNTIEFWFKKESYDASLTKRQVIFDMWNNVSVTDYQNSSYGRIRIEYVEYDGRPLIYFTYLLPSDNLNNSNTTSNGVIDLALGYDSALPLDYYSTWQHVAISVINEGPNLKINFFLNGEEKEEKIALSQAAAVMPAPHVARIGALVTGHEFDKIPLSINFNKKATVNNVANNDNTIIEVDTTDENGNPFPNDASAYRMFVTDGNIRITDSQSNLVNWLSYSPGRLDPNGILSDNVTKGTALVRDETILYFMAQRVAQDAPGVYREIDTQEVINNPGAWVDLFEDPIAGEGASTIYIKVSISNSAGDTLQEYYVPADGTGYLDIQENKQLSLPGAGKMSASIDEFRFWKTRRSSRQISRWHVQQIGGGNNSGRQQDLGSLL